VGVNKHFRRRHKDLKEVVENDGEDVDVDGEDTSAGNIHPVSDQFLQTGVTFVARCNFQTMDMFAIRAF